ncbi:MAG: tetratricopeptide repeat protein [Saprospiraceae bacterium]
MRNILILFVLLGFQFLEAQRNCNMYPEGSPCREACETGSLASRYPQGSRKNMELYTKAAQKCPSFAPAWEQLSVPYLKRGDYLNWKLMIDKAVALDPMNILGYRAACSYEFIHDVVSALNDFERLDSLKSGHLGYNPNGDYNLRIMKGLCYRDLGKLDKAIEEIRLAIEEGVKEGGGVGTYDYLHLGVSYLMKKDVDSAFQYFTLQIPLYKNFPDTYYYLGLCYKAKNQMDLAKSNFEKAKALYPKNHRKDPYVHMPDQVYLSDIEEELSSLNTSN